MAAAGVPQGYDSRADWGKGITSAMRAGEKSKSPGYPGNSVSSAYQASLNNLIVKERGSGMDLAGINNTSIEQMLESGIPVHETQVVGVNDERVHEAWDVAQKIKQEWAKGVEAFGTVKNEEKVVITTDEYIDPHKYNRDRKGQIITDTPAHNQLHSDKTPIYEDWSLGTNAIEAIVKDEALTKDTKELAIEAKKLADAKELEAYKASQANLAAEVASNNKRIRFEQAKEQGAKNAAELTAEMEQDIVDAADALAKEKAMAEANAEDLARIQENLKGVMEQLEDTVVLTKDGEKIYTDVDAQGYLLKDTFIGTDYKNIHEGEVLKAGTPITDNAKMTDELKRIEHEIHAGEDEARKAQLLKEKLAKEKAAAEMAAVKEAASTTPLGESQNERLKDKKAKENLESNAKTTPIGSGVAQRERELQRKLEQERKEKAAEQRAAHDKFQNDRIDNIANEGDKKSSALQQKMREQKKQQEAMFKRLDDSENAFQEDNGAVNTRSMMAAGPKDPYAFSTLSYPSDLTHSNENGHYILFYVNVQNQTKYEYDGLDSEHKRVMVGDMVEVPAHFTEGTGPRNQYGSEWVKLGSAKSGDHLRADYQKQIIKNGGPGNILYNNMTVLRQSRKGPLTGINSRYQTTTRITDSIALYLPPGINDNLSVTYGDSATGMAGYLALSGVDLVRQIREHDFAGATSTLFDSGGAIIEEAAKKLAAGAFETFTGSEGIRETFDKAFGQTLNPYIEVTYNAMGMRTFDYTFKFAPKSRKETDEVKAIIQLFRFHMAPELKDTHHRYMTLPSTFDIHYMWQSGAGDTSTAQENSFYNKIATCVLTRCDVDYTPEGVRSFGDGAPTQINMTLSFKETEMITKQKIAQGF